MTNREILKMLFNVDHNFDTNDYYKLVGGYNKEDIMFSQMWLNKECDTLPLHTQIKYVWMDSKDTRCRCHPYQAPQIKNVIFHPPATIVFWDDNTKTVVKCRKGEEFDPHVGLAMCICKKVYDYRYGGIFRKWTKKYKVPTPKRDPHMTLEQSKKNMGRIFGMNPEGATFTFTCKMEDIKEENK